MPTYWHWSRHGTKDGDSHYNLNQRNCVHFVQEAARRIGLVGLDHPELMKKPRSYLKAVAQANADRVTVIGQDGKEYLASLPPLPAAPVAPSPAPTQPVTSQFEYVDHRFISRKREGDPPMRRIDPFHHARHVAGPVAAIGVGPLLVPRIIVPRKMLRASVSG